MSSVMYGAAFEDINHSGEGGFHVEILRDWSFEARAWLTANPEYTKPDISKTKAKPVAANVPKPHSRNTTLQAKSMESDSVGAAPMYDLGAWRISPESTKAALEVIQPGGSGREEAEQALLKAQAGDAGKATATPKREHHALCLQPDAGQEVEVSNLGHSLKGFRLAPESMYRVRMRVRGSIDPIQVHITSDKGLGSFAPLELGRAQKDPQAWVVLTGKIQTEKGGDGLYLSLRFKGPGKLCIDWVSFTPDENWDLGGRFSPFAAGVMAALQKLRIQYLRFPGGSYMEGVTLATSYRWKEGVGPREMRPGHANAVWGYWSSDGLGLYEMMGLCEVLGAEPVWVVQLGMSQAESTPPDELAPWLQDGLDSLDFIMGSAATTQWGAVRAAMGRQEPWGLRYVVLGNSGCLRPWYRQNFHAFSQAVRARYPHLHILANCDLSAAPGQDADPDFDLWEFHSYRSPKETYALRTAVEQYEGPPVGVTEFASIDDESALGGLAAGALMTALERNCRKVRMVAFSPLLGHGELRTWNVNVITFDSTGAWIPTPSYVVQRVFGAHTGAACAVVRQEGAPEGIEVSAVCIDERCSAYNIKLANFHPAPRLVSLRIKKPRAALSWLTVAAPRTVEVSATRLFSERPHKTKNTWKEPQAFAPVDFTLRMAEWGESLLTLPGYSITVLRIGEQQHPKQQQKGQ